ncbi:hypothetical protein ONE63_001024 [Megalurothrips usitatus]|uniref:Uncharacterized protein n=1 Tax=Megalurothrips usitatus TaxID=439358 RepID=A0AAV7XI28_9NEOP|nr:hypothetical protein ONE63_001024 [Megalurothrips usitatus]
MGFEYLVQYKEISCIVEAETQTRAAVVNALNESEELSLSEDEVKFKYWVERYSTYVDLQPAADFPPVNTRLLISDVPRAVVNVPPIGDNQPPLVDKNISNDSLNGDNGDNAASGKTEKEKLCSQKKVRDCRKLRNNLMQTIKEDLERFSDYPSSAFQVACNTLVAKFPGLKDEQSSDRDSNLTTVQFCLLMQALVKQKQLLLFTSRQSVNSGILPTQILESSVAGWIELSWTDLNASRVLEEYPNMSDCFQLLKDVQRYFDWDFLKSRKEYLTEMRVNGLYDQLLKKPMVAKDKAFDSKACQTGSSSRLSATPCKEKPHGLVKTLSKNKPVPATEHHAQIVIVKGDAEEEGDSYYVFLDKQLLCSNCLDPASALDVLMAANYLFDTVFPLGGTCRSLAEMLYSIMCHL